MSDHQHHDPIVDLCEALGVDMADLYAVTIEAFADGPTMITTTRMVSGEVNRDPIQAHYEVLAVRTDGEDLPIEPTSHLIE